MKAKASRSREKEIRKGILLERALQVLAEEGYSGFTIEKLAARAEYSRTTVYQHFGSKDEVVGALALEGHRLLFGVIRKGSGFEGSPRERYLALMRAYEFFVRLHPLNHWCNHTINLHQVPARFSPAIRRALSRTKEQVLGKIKRVIHDAMEAGDLELGGLATETVILASYALLNSIYTSSVTGNEWIAPLRLEDLFTQSRIILARLLDGFRWEPLSERYDYEATYGRMTETVFKAEWLQLQMNALAREQPGAV